VRPGDVRSLPDKKANILKIVMEYLALFAKFAGSQKEMYSG
jgi:hypothetical protein